MELRINRLKIFAALAFAMLALNLFYMQIIKGKYYRSLSEKNRIRVFYLEGARGNIIDRNGEFLASSRLSFNLSVIPRDAKSRLGQSLKILSNILHVDEETLKTRFQKRKPGAYNSVLVAEDINPLQAMSIEERLDGLPGFMIETRPQREYADGEAAAHLLGYIGPMSEEEKYELPDYGYSLKDWIGREGVEKSYETYLKGQSGGLQIEVDSRGRFIRALGVKEPIAGKDVQLTVDAKLQRFIQDGFGARRGAVIVVDVTDGSILAMNSAPSFNPNLFSSVRGRKDVGKYFKDEDTPLINRAIRSRYPSGSIFKIITSLAALERGKLNSNTTYFCTGAASIGGKIFRCWRDGGHGSQNLTEALAHSCDVFFYRTGIAAGADAIAKKASQFGMGVKTGIDLPGEKAGFVPTRDWKKKVKRESWFDGDTANFSIGQGFLQMTPIEAVLMVAATATEGELLRPHLIKEVAGVKVSEKHVQRLNIPKAHLEAVRLGLDTVVNSETGTGRLARNKNFRVAGKTGTAQSGQGEDHAWFVGYAPARNPKIAMVVFIENGGHGGVAAAGFAGNIFNWLKDAGYL